MSIIDELKEIFPKDLVHIFVAYIIDKLNFEDEEDNEKIILLALKASGIGPDGIEPKINPTIRDAKIYVKYFNHYDSLLYYSFKSSEYLVKKFMNKKNIHNVIINDIVNGEYMNEVFRDMGVYTPEILWKAIEISSNRVENILYKKVLKIFKDLLAKNNVSVRPSVSRTLFLSKRSLRNSQNAIYFAKIFRFMNNEENYMKCLEMMDIDSLKKEYVEFQDSGKNSTWIKASYTFEMLK